MEQRFSREGKSFLNKYQIDQIMRFSFHV